jgi:DNA-binding IclR family transcriptional regulator
MAERTGATNQIQATFVTFAVLEGLKELDGAGVTELARHLDMSKSNVHNYLSTLHEEEFVVKEGTTYDVGLRFMDLARYARQKQEIYDVAKPELDKLADETGELVNLLVEEHGRGVYLYRAEGEQSVEVDATIGHRVYLHNTGLGKAILAEMPDERVEEIVDRHGLPATTDRTVTDRDELFEKLDEVRDRGVAFDLQERLQGLNCVARAVTDDKNDVMGAISVSGPASRMDGDLLREELPQKLESITNIISLNLTYS